jgi:hypothetical protein
MEQTPSNNISKRDHLSTVIINPEQINPKKIDTDLQMLKAAETKKRVVPVYMDTQESMQEMKALKVANPFRGY